MRVATFAHHMQRRRATASAHTCPEIGLEAIEQSFELRRGTGEEHRRDHDELIGVLQQRVDIVHVVANDATMRRLVFCTLGLKGLLIGLLPLGQLVFRLPFAEIACGAAGDVERGDGRQEHLIFGALLDARFEQKVRKRAAAPLNARRPNDDQAFHSQFLSVSPACAQACCHDVAGRSSSVRALRASCSISSRRAESVSQPSTSAIRAAVNVT